ILNSILSSATNLKLIDKLSDEIRYQIIIDNPDDEGIGEIRVKTRGIMNGYFRSEKLTKEAFDSEGYFKTGDNGFIDENNILHITGRIKESVVLSSGKKVSPADVDNYYQNVCKNINIASCGIPDKSGMYDELYMFIETNGQNKKTLEEAEKSINKLSLTQNNVFKLSKIVYIDTIPKTSIGKVKRFLLQESVKQNHISHIENKSDDANNKADNIDSVREFVYNSIEKITNHKVDRNDNLNLIEDLGVKSLDVFSLYNEIEKTYHINIAEISSDIKTIGDIINTIENSDVSTKIVRKNRINLND
ncbi:MAG: AMP-binding protein, partial [Ruminococcus sp.]|nr:AMP-binding protein [Ruminococcus sp.]